MLLETPELANVIATSILIQDSTGAIGIVKRGQNVAISSGTFAATSSGSVSIEDLMQEDPIRSCVLRELKEELNIEEELISLRMSELIISKQKMQPVALYTGEINVTFEELVGKMKQAEDFSFENQLFLKIPKEKILPFISKRVLTDASAYQLYKFAIENGESPSWFKAILKRVNVKSFLLK
jgi:hypothetical protein